MLTQLAEDNFTSKTGIIQQLVSKQFKSTYGDVEPRVFIDEPKEDTKPQ